MERAKTIIVAIWSIIMSALGILAIPVMLLITCNIIDYATGLVVSYSADVAGITLPFTFLVACIAAVWLVCNEIISILENINDIGVTLPPFLQPIVKNLKKQVENKAVINSIEKDNESED